MVYGPLSDRTHPNFGATHIGMTIGDDALPVFTLRPLYDEGNIDELLSAMFLMLTVAAEALNAVVDAATKHPVEFRSGEPQWRDDDLWPSGTAPGA
jgi:hypothetical protein